MSALPQKPLPAAFRLPWRGWEGWRGIGLPARAAAKPTQPGRTLQHRRSPDLLSSSAPSQASPSSSTHPTAKPQKGSSASPGTNAELCRQSPEFKVSGFTKS